MTHEKTQCEIVCKAFSGNGLRAKESTSFHQENIWGSHSFGMSDP